MSHRSFSWASFDDAAAREIVARAAISANPHDLPAQLRLSDMLMLDDRLDQAASALDEAIMLNPEAPALHVQRALVLARQGRHDAARQALDRAAARTAPDSRIHRQLLETVAQGKHLPDPAPGGRI